MRESQGHTKALPAGSIASHSCIDERSPVCIDDSKKLSLSSGYTVPVDTERVLKQAALNCAETYFDDEEKQRLPMLVATMAEFSITPRATNADTMMSEMPRACVTQGVNVSREGLGI